MEGYAYGEKRNLKINLINEEKKMSMNLTAKNKDGYINLWQTPTQISYTILPPTITVAKNKKAVEAIERYCSWVRYSSNGAWSSQKDYEEHCDIIKEHLKYIKKEMTKSKLEVSVS